MPFAEQIDIISATTERGSEMERILIIGNAGAGKSTFAKELAKRLALPLIHLDRLYWRGNWEHLSRDEFDTALQVQLDKPVWIIDGNFNRTIPHRLKYCDTVFFFDLPTAVCLLGITKRVLMNYGRTRDDMGGSCPEYFDGQKTVLYRNVLNFNREHRKDYYKLLTEVSHARVIVFKSRKQAAQFLKEL